jgi:hypothetical protein
VIDLARDWLVEMLSPGDSGGSSAAAATEHRARRSR